MNKEIISREDIILTKGETEKEISTSIKHLRTYNQRITKGEIYLEQKENSPVDIFIKTQNGNNYCYAKISDIGPEQYQIKKDELLGSLIEEPKKTR